jgi:hypothetical protein
LSIRYGVVDSDDTSPVERRVAPHIAAELATRRMIGPDPLEALRDRS